jgi:hypothetical protein
MNTNELIERLGRDLVPVKPLWRPWKRAAVWFVAAAIYVVTLAYSLSGTGALSNANGTGFLLTQVAAIVTCVLAIRAAFASVVPGYSKAVFVWPALGALFWLGTLIGAAPWQTEPTTILAARHEWWCVALIIVGGAPPLAVLALMLRRGAALTPIKTATLAAIAVGALINVAACLWRPHPNEDVALLWHGAALLALVLICICGAQSVLRVPGWRRP